MAQCPPLTINTQLNATSYEVSSVYPPHYDLVLAICPAAILTLSLWCCRVWGDQGEPSEINAASCHEVYLPWNAVAITANHTNMSPHWREHIISNAELTLQMCIVETTQSSWMCCAVRVDLPLLISSHGLNEAWLVCYWHWKLLLS